MKGKHIKKILILVLIIIAPAVISGCSYFKKKDSSSNSSSSSNLRKSKSYTSSSADFEKAFKDVIKYEGGYYDKENDASGEVRYGVTGTTARRHGYKGSMKKLPMSFAKKVFKKSYWNPLPDNISPRAKFIAFDAAINQGLGYARSLVRKTNGNPDKMISARKNRYRTTASKRPDLKKFLKGWLNRMRHVEKAARSYKA